MNMIEKRQQALLDEVEEYFKNHGMVRGVAFSEESLLQRIEAIRSDIKQKSAIDGTAKPMNGKDIIPEMDDPLGAYWEQPNRQMIFIRDGKALLDAQDFKKLKSYDSSLPSGVYPGKMWKRTNAGVSYLCWFGEDKGGHCTINHLPIEVAQQALAA
jgi:hypothetical protein